MARYWAWTGVPFTYLVNPAGLKVGTYATTAVLGATNWQAPNWMGMPVQWCGLVYCDAIYRLARYDKDGPWTKLADGIAISGIQQSYPASAVDLQGLLPDSFNLRPQTRNPVAINPGTVQANAVRAMGKSPLYDFHAFHAAGIMVHVPGEITEPAESNGSASFKVAPWSHKPYYILITGCTAPPTVTVNGKAVVFGAGDVYDSHLKVAILRLVGPSKIECKER